ALQDFISTQRFIELDERHVLDQTGQVDGSFNTGVAPADYSHILALEKRAVAVRAVSHTGVAIFAFSRNVDLTPAGTRSENHGTALEHATIFKFDFHDLAGLELDCALQIHDVD